MTSQQKADLMLAEWREAKLRLAVTRSEALRNFYRAQREAGMGSIEANELTAEHAKWLDNNYEATQAAVKVEMEKMS